MTHARATIVLASQHGLYRCTNRCVRRAWLCGIDPDTKQNYEHRKAKVEARIQQLGAIFAVGIYGYAVMSNHLHVVLSVEAAVATNWSKEEVIERWVQLYPARTAEQMDEKRARFLGNPEAIACCRKRLMDLSWFMRGKCPALRISSTPHPELRKNSAADLPTGIAHGHLMRSTLVARFAAANRPPRTGRLSPRQAR